MNVPTNRAGDAVVRATANAPATVLVGTGVAGVLGASAVAATGRFAVSGALLAAASVAAYAGRAAGGARGWPSRWMEYLCTVHGRVGDAPVLAGIAWWLRTASMRESIVAVAAISLVFLTAYAEVRARSLSYHPPRSPAGAAERGAVVAAGLVIPHAAEPALWIVAAIGAISFLRIATSVWREAGPAARTTA